MGAEVLAIIYSMTNSSQLNGVNLGGWLVLERWITPSVFAGSKARDEYSLSQNASGREKIKKHRSQFIVKDDIKWLADNGFTAVRIPVGYWLFDKKSMPYLHGTAPLDDCMRWCEQYGLKVLICLHGAPGSQNGHDHSGRVGKIGIWRRQNYQKTLEILEVITKRYQKSPVFWGLEIVNEPMLGSINYWRTLRLYRQAYRRIRKVSSRPKVIFSDGYRPRLMNAAILFGKNTAMDIHQYHMLTMFKVLSRLHMRWYRWRLVRRQRLYRRLARFQPIIIGEWSAVMGYELLQNENMKESDFWQEHVDLQAKTYSSAEAKFYWTYKTEGKNSWNLRHLVEEEKIVIQ